MEALATVLKQLIAARQPTVLHRKARPMPPTWAFDLARAATERSLAGTPGARMRLYGNGQELPLSAELLPQPPDTHLAGWLDRVQLRDPGLILNNVQCLSPEVWRWVRQILGSIFEDHMPAGGCSLEIFTGRYPQSFFGLHKDDQDVVTFVLEGTKVFYVWPFEVFSALAPGLQPMGNHALPDVDWRQHSSARNQTASSAWSTASRPSPTTACQRSTRSTCTRCWITSASWRGFPSPATRCCASCTIRPCRRCAAIAIC